MDGIQQKSPKLDFECQFCKTQFAKESTFHVHVCEKKRRYLAKDEKHVRFGLYAFNKFYEIQQRSSTKKTPDEFIESSFYTAFVKFGSYIVNSKPIYPNRFIEYIIRLNIKLSKWCDDDLYENYIKTLVKIEPIEGAIERTIETMAQWGKDNNRPFECYFTEVSTVIATRHIKDGLISPWVLLNSKTGQNLLGRLSDEQILIIGNVIDPAFWTNRFKQLPKDVQLSKDIIREAEL